MAHAFTQIVALLGNIPPQSVVGQSGEFILFVLGKERDRTNVAALAQPGQHVTQKRIINLAGLEGANPCGQPGFDLARLPIFREQTEMIQ